MTAPTTSEFWNQTTPAAPSGDQNVVIQSDGATPQQSLTAYPKTATASLRGVVKPDGTTINVAGDGTISAVTNPVALLGAQGITIDGGGATPAAGLKGFIQIPYNFTITGWSIIADQVGSASVDIWFLAGSAPPTVPSIPTSANKISASAPIALSSAQSAAGGSSAISTWTKSLTQWGELAWSLASASGVTRITLQIWGTKS